MPSTLKPFLGSGHQRERHRRHKRNFPQSRRRGYQKKILNPQGFLRSPISILVHRFYEEEKFGSVR